MAMQQHQKRCQLPMHQLRPQRLSLWLDRVVVEQMPGAKPRLVAEVEQIAEGELPVDDARAEVAVKSDKSQSSTKRSLVSVE
jgi:hypothetical protein